VTDASETQTDAASNPTTWVARHGDALYRYAMLRVGDSTVAEDLVQESFLAALDARKRFSARSSERTWLIGILKRKVVDHIRKDARQQAVESVDDVESADRHFFTAEGLWKGAIRRWGADPRSDSEKREFWAVFRRCMSHLPPKMADAFLLRELDQMDGEEVCKVLNISATNLWARLHRARLRLQECLQTNWFADRHR
jgi:RNA polymerase sigma-70 factor (ECF subfamily)